MRVKLLVHLTGTRNGVEWPGYHEEMELPDDEAASMVAAGLAEPVTKHRDAETRPATASEERGVEATRKALVPTRSVKGSAK
jgi:hypothetical protein